MRWFLAMLALTSTCAAQELRGPALAAASNFGQGFPRGLLSAAIDHGILDFRDAVYWADVEGSDGTFRFGPVTATYPDRMADRGAGMTLTVNNGHPSYEGGATPLGPEAVAAFGTHAAQVAARFPAITGIEVGNEFNSVNFVSGPLRDQGLEARAEAYDALMTSVAEQARAVRPDIRIIGAGVHSIPTGYLRYLEGLGTFTRMDSLAFHPYDTPPEVLPQQVTEMRRIRGLETMPLEITEYGTPDTAAAPSLLLRIHCQAALSGVSRIARYPLHPRGDDFAPLLLRDGSITPVGETFAFVRDRLANRPVADIALGGMTRACRYGDDTLVVWGVPRQIRVIDPELRIFDANGPRNGATYELSETNPLIFISPTGQNPIDGLMLAPQAVLADSFFQFAYGEDTPGFTRWSRTPNGLTRLTVQPGQGRSGVPWTPYLGQTDNPELRLLSTSMLPAGTVDFPSEVVHRFIADHATEARLDLRLTPSPRSTDGISVTVELNGFPIYEQAGPGPIDQSLNLTLALGSVLDIGVGPNAIATGDVTEYRFTLSRR